MAAMTTALTKYSDDGNVRTSTISGHTTQEPHLVIEKRQVPGSAEGSAQYIVSVIYGTTDSEGTVLSSKVAFEMKVRYPLQGDSADVTSALAVIRDIVAGDEFGASVTSLGWLDP